jgi:subtilisin family serine protease
MFNPRMLTVRTGCQPRRFIEGTGFMRVLIGILMAGVLAASARAQLRLPIAPLPALPVQKLTQTLGQVGADSLDQLSQLRQAQIGRLVRANPHTLATDPRGNAIIRDELLAYSPTDQALQDAQARGFKILRVQTSGELGLKLVVLQPPPMKIAKALQQLRAADSAGVYDFNHVYTGSGQASPSNPRSVAASVPTDGARAESTAARRVGLVDSGIDTAHAVFHDAVIHSWVCEGRVLPSAHATAVASLLVGQADHFHGVMDKAELYAADVYCNAPTGGSVEALAAAFAWLAQQRVPVINVSLVGPDNAALAALVHALVARGYLLVAAVGNDGPAAPPLYPASYAGVVGVTGVDARRRVLIEAARGNQVMFAAPGADMAAADVGEKYAIVRGTSFAAPIVTGLLALAVTTPDARGSAAAIDALAQSAVDLGPPGRDLTYGYGLVGAESRTDPASLGPLNRPRQKD